MRSLSCDTIRRSRIATRLSSGKLLDARAETRELARGGIAMEDACPHAAMDHRLCFLQRCCSALLVAGVDRGLDLLDEAAHVRYAGAIDGGAPHGLSNAFLRRCMMGHLEARFPRLGVRRRLISAAPSLVKRSAAPSAILLGGDTVAKGCQ